MSLRLSRSWLWASVVVASVAVGAFSASCSSNGSEEDGNGPPGDGDGGADGTGDGWELDGGDPDSVFDTAKPKTVSVYKCPDCPDFPGLDAPTCPAGALTAPKIAYPLNGIL